MERPVGRARWRGLHALIALATLPPPACAQSGNELATKDYSIYGKAQQRDIRPSFIDATRRCFFGFGFIQCESVGEPPSLVNSPYHWRTAVADGSQFCLQCCDNMRQTRTFSETWNLRCDVAAGGKQKDLIINTDPYQYEFRFARRDTLDDRELVTCPILRPPEVWVVNVSDAVGPIGGYFQLLVGGRTGAQYGGLSDRISFDAVPMAWQEQRLCSGDTCPGAGLGESLEAKLYKPLKKLKEAGGVAYPTFFPVTVTRSDSLPARNNGTRYGFTWSITFPANTFPSIVDSDETNHYVQVNNRLQSPSGIPDVTVTQATPTQMHGYKLDLEVKEKHEGINFWRSVRSCNVTTMERQGPPTYFYESYRLYSTESAAPPGVRPRAALALGAATLTLALARL